MAKQEDCIVYLFHARVRVRSQSGKMEQEIQHYVGSTERRFQTRLGEHLRGNGAGAAVTELFLRNGGFDVARIWEGCGSNQEYYIKYQYKNIARLCPTCCGAEAYNRLPVEYLRKQKPSAEAIRKVRARRGTRR